MNNLGCYGDEGYLAHCHYQDNVIGCSHRGNEVGVRCYQSGNMLERCSDIISYCYTVYKCVCLYSHTVKKHVLLSKGVLFLCNKLVISAWCACIQVFPAINLYALIIES